ncbi:MAG: phosphodiester glycosidase family protein [Muribaculaceae bacterium]|nr:phosphodiester glycosidase family protein [Muribaculaceae bacterium]
MKKSYIVMAAGLLALSASAKTTWQTSQLGTVTVDTVYHATVGPGTTQTLINISYTRNGSAATSQVTYTTTDLTNEYVTIKAAVASNRAYGKPATPKAMADLNTSYQNHYFAGINADFAGLESTQSIPCGALMVDGNYVTPPATLSGGLLSNYLVIDKDGLPQIASEISSFGGINYNNGVVTYPNGAVQEGLRTNCDRYENYIVAYNEFYGYGKTDYGQTNTNQWGMEAELLPIESNVIYGNEAEFIVNAKATAGNMKVPHKGLVLSGVGDTRAGKLDAVKAGEKVKIKFPFTADGKEMSAREVIGGWGITVKDGEVTKQPSKVPSDIATNTPRARTSIGYNADKTKFVMAVVSETTSSGANGMKIWEFAEVMKALGCTEALNFDGGGSSTLYVENLGYRAAVQNKLNSNLSYNGYIRAVANGLFAVTNAPETQEVARIEFVDKALTIKPGRGYQPVIYAYNKYGVLISTGLQNYTLSAPEATFDASKRKMIAPESGYFALTATYNGITTTIPVKVDADGVSGSDPATAPSFSGQEFVTMLEKPADWVDPNQTNIYIVGKQQDWNFSNPLVVNPYPGKNGIYEFDYDSTDKTADGSYFKMTTLDPRTNGGSAAFTQIDHAWHINNDVVSGKDKPDADILGNGKTLTMIPGNANNIKAPWNGKWHYVVDLNEKTITATTETPRPAVSATTVSLVAEIDGEAMTLDLDGTNGMFKANNVNITGTALSFLVDDVAYGPAINGTELTESDDFYVSPANKWTVEPGTYNITFSTNTNTVTAVRAVYAILDDVTPAGYDFDKYDEKTPWKFAALPSSTTTGTWTAPAGIYTQKAMTEDGHVTALHLQGVDLDKQHSSVTSGTGAVIDLLSDREKAFAVCEHPVAGNCLVFSQNYSCGTYRFGWPNTVQNYSATQQLSFYADPTTINGEDADHPVRFRIVFQIIYRGRHAQPGTNEIPSIYASAVGTGSVWATSHNGVGDNTVGAQYPINHQSFYKWVGEGSTVAEMPEVQTLLEVDKTVAEPWDWNTATGKPFEPGQQDHKYLINDERFMVYEFDFYGKPEGGTLAVHVNMANGSYANYVIKEVKFYNVLNQDELMGKKKAANGPAKVPAAELKFRSATVPGSLLGTRGISYRYYTEDGMKEFQQEELNTGVDNVAVDDNTAAPVEYYNLQGVRVENPAPGLYIKCQGNTATKVIIR